MQPVKCPYLVAKANQSGAGKTKDPGGAKRMEDHSEVEGSES